MINEEQILRDMEDSGYTLDKRSIRPLFPCGHVDEIIVCVPVGPTSTPEQVNQRFKEAIDDIESGRAHTNCSRCTQPLLPSEAFPVSEPEGHRQEQKLGFYGDFPTPVPDQVISAWKFLLGEAGGAFDFDV